MVIHIHIYETWLSPISVAHVCLGLTTLRLKNLTERLSLKKTESPSLSRCWQLVVHLGPEVCEIFPILVGM